MVSPKAVKPVKMYTPSEKISLRETLFCPILVPPNIGHLWIKYTLQGVLYLKVSLYNWSQATSLLPDFDPVSVTLLRREESKTISVTARDDDIALEGGDKIILRHTSGLNNYVNEVEQRGEFIRYTTEVIIIDKNGKS